MIDRLQKILSRYGVASRRSAEQLILSGRVCLNGQVVTELGIKADPDCDRIAVDGKIINHKPTLTYLLLHKPIGFICSRHDPQGRQTISQLLPSHYQHLYSVGRLDYDSSGALLLTNDGDFAHQLMHPRHHVPKTYEVIVQGCPSDRLLQQWRQGVLLENKMTLPAQVEVIQTLPQIGLRNSRDFRNRNQQQQQQQTQLQIILQEGRNRQIRKVAASLGFPVIALHRVAIANIQLANLAPQSHRHLTIQELDQLQALPTFLEYGESKQRTE